MGGEGFFCLYFVVFINVLLLLFVLFFSLFFGCFFCLVFERWKEMFYLTTHSTYFVYGYMALGIWHSDSERGNPLPPHGLLFPISSKGYFICIITHTG